MEMFRSAPSSSRKVTSSVFLASFLAAGASYPFAVAIRDAAELLPRQISTDVFQNNYRKVLYHYWNNENGTNGFAGLYKRYFYKTFPWMFTVS